VYFLEGVVMPKNEKAIVTTLCMIYHENRILLQDVHKGDWRGLFFPGGHVEKGESFMQAIIREIKEETGLDIRNPQLCGVKQWQTDDDERYIVMLYKTSEFSGDLSSSDEGEMTWVNRNDLPAAKVADGFFDTLKVFDDTSITELYYVYDKQNKKWISTFY